MCLICLPYLRRILNSCKVNPMIIWAWNGWTHAGLTIEHCARQLNTSLSQHKHSATRKDFLFKTIEYCAHCWLNTSTNSCHNISKVIHCHGKTSCTKTFNLADCPKGQGSIQVQTSWVPLSPNITLGESKSPRLHPCSLLNFESLWVSHRYFVLVVLSACYPSVCCVLSGSTALSE